MTGQIATLLFALALVGGCRFDSSGLAGAPPPAMDVEINDGPGIEWPPSDGPRRERVLTLVDRPALDNQQAPRAEQPHPDLPLPDMDGDKVPDGVDNCPSVANPGQSDTDGDKLGDLCDTDIDGDTVPNEIDPNPSVADTVYHYSQPMLASAMSGVGSWGPLPPNVGHCQKTVDGYDYDVMRLTATFPGTDYLVQTRFTMPDWASTGGWPGAGPIFRSTSASIPTGYICVVDPRNKRLVVGRFGTIGTWTEITSTGNNSVTTTGPWTIRASAKGSQIGCSELTSGQTLSITDGTLGSGTAGVFAFQAQACFEYLLVTKL